MAVITIAASFFTAKWVDILKITRIISHNQSQLNSVILTPLPYSLVGVEIFLLKIWLMWPDKLVEQERVFNYCLSSARRVIANCFGIPAARWRIFSTPIEESALNAERYTLVCIALHNDLRQTKNSSYCPNSFIDCENSTGDLKEGK